MRYLIDFVDSAEQTAIDAYLAANSCTVVRDFQNFSRTYLVECASEPAADALVEALIEDSSAPMDLLIGETKTFPVDETDNWWKPVVLDGVDVEAPTATIARSGMGVRVYLLDSGIDASHSEFADKDITLLHSITPGDFSDTTGHGTALASVIVGETCGITEAALKVVKIFHDGQATLVSDLISAFDAVATDYETSSEFLAVMNLSWSIAKNTYIETKINTLIDLGVVVIASAGNDGQPVANVTPAGMADVVTVGSFGKDLEPSDFSNYTVTDSSTSFTEGETNYGAGLDCFAPGEFIRVAVPGGTFGNSMGTSLSAAIVSAICALRIASSGYNWNNGIDFNPNTFLSEISVRNVLTLSGNYVGSPNVIVSTNITGLMERYRRARFLMAPMEVTQSVWMFHGEFYENVSLIGAPAWVSLQGSYLVFTAPLSETVEGYVFQISLDNVEGNTEVLEVVIATKPEEMELAVAREELDIMFANNYASTACIQDCMNRFAYQYCCECCYGGDGKYGTEDDVCGACSQFECQIQDCFGSGL